MNIRGKSEMIENFTKWPHYIKCFKLISLPVGDPTGRRWNKLYSLRLTSDKGKKRVVSNYTQLMTGCQVCIQQINSHSKRAWNNERGKQIEKDHRRLCNETGTPFFSNSNSPSLHNTHKEKHKQTNVGLN